MLSALILTELGYPAVQLAPQPVNQRFVHPGPLVLRTDLRKFPTPTTDRDRTVSRRSEPSSRATLIGEQPNPWDLLQPQDVTSRHRGAKPLRRFELLGAISLLSPEYRLIAPKSSNRRSGLAPRCRLVTSWGWSRSQGFGCSPIKVARELGSERRETVRSLSVVGVGSLRSSVLSTRGPGRTNLWSSGCGASRTAGYPRSVRISAESI